MKKILLLLLLSGTKAYSQLTPMIDMMFPEDRHILAQSTMESAQAYETAGRKTKATAYYRSALQIYPIGDKAHVLANKIGYKLDDNKTYSNFLKQGHRMLSNKQYQKALGNYLMAKEIQGSFELYQKLSEVYTKLKQNNDALFYQDLANGINPANDKMLSDEDSAQYDNKTSKNSIDTESINAIVEEDYYNQEN